MRKWVTYHGISLNLAPDLSHYDAIVPCGLDPVLEPVGALNPKIGRNLAPADVVPVFLNEFQDVFEVDLEYDQATSVPGGGSPASSPADTHAINLDPLSA